MFFYLLNFLESVPNFDIEDMLDDFVTFFIAGKTCNT